MNNDAPRSITRAEIERAAEAGVIARAQVDPLWHFLADASGPAAVPTTPDVASAPRFGTVQLLWYAGALFVIGAMSLFTTLAFQAIGSIALTFTAVVYATGFMIAGDRLWRRGLLVPAGLLVTIAVAMTPLAVFGIQDAAGWWDGGKAPGLYRDFHVWIKAGWLPMEIATVIAGVVALRFYPYPFIVMPIAVSLWYMSMDLTPWFFGDRWDHWDQRKVVSLWFGLATLVIAWVVDLRARADLAFWLHLAGLAAFWGGLSLMDSGSEWGKAIYVLINIVLLGLSVFLARRAYAVVGAVGVAAYLGYLSYRVFEDSLLFPFMLSAIGIAIIALGLYLHRHTARIEAWVTRHVPPALQALRPPHARGLVHA
jgi:hypothetical protein